MPTRVHHRGGLTACALSVLALGLAVPATAPAQSSTEVQEVATAEASAQKAGVKKAGARKAVASKAGAKKAGAKKRKFGSRTLKKGMRGKDVRFLQRALTIIGYPTPVDGAFGPSTKRSVKKLERKKRWRIDGKVTRKDAKRIIRIVAKRRGKRGIVYYAYGLYRPSVALTAQRSGTARVDVVDTNSGSAVASLSVSFSGSGAEAINWSGITSSGGYAPDSSYQFKVADANGTGAVLSGGQVTPFRFRQHAFPVPGPHSYGGAGSRFGAPRSGHTHQGQDVAAACGSPLHVVESGTLWVKAYQASGAGYYIVIRGVVSGTDYVYMHLQNPTWAAASSVVYAGQQIAKVGNTGSSSGCHLHFEHWTAPGWYQGGYPYDPLAELQYWDAYS